jgi:hypothetical protein
MMRRLISGNVCGGTKPLLRAGFLIALARIVRDYRDNIEE